MTRQRLRPDPALLRRLPEALRSRPRAITIRCVGAGIAELIGERTRAVFLESPGSLTMEVQDVPAICAAAKARGVATLLDNTWATPLFFPAIAAGIDLSILAGTKYVGGHADVMLGSVTATADCYPKLERTSWDLGHVGQPRRCLALLAGAEDDGGAPSPARGERAQDRPLARGAAAGGGGAPSGAAGLPRPRTLGERLQGLVRALLLRPARAAATPSGSGSSRRWSCSASATAGAAMRAWSSRPIRSGSGPRPAGRRKGRWSGSRSASRIRTI